MDRSNPPPLMKTGSSELGMLVSLAVERNRRLKVIQTWTTVVGIAAFFLMLLVGGVVILAVLGAGGAALR